MSLDAVMKDAFETLANKLKSEGKTTISMGELGAFYDKFPKFRGTITATSLDTFCATCGLSYNKKTNSIVLNVNTTSSTGPATPSVEHDAKVMVELLARLIRSSASNQWPTNEIATFYKVYPKYNKLFKMTYIEKYGIEFGLKCNNRFITLIEQQAPQQCVASAVKEPTTKPSMVQTTASANTSPAVVSTANVSSVNSSTANMSFSTAATSTKAVTTTAPTSVLHDLYSTNTTITPSSHATKQFSTTAAIPAVPIVTPANTAVSTTMIDSKKSSISTVGTTIAPTVTNISTLPDLPPLPSLSSANPDRKIEAESQSATSIITPAYEVVLVVDIVQSARIVTQILNDHTMIALDMEMEVEENTITLIQVAVTSPTFSAMQAPATKVYLFDILEASELLIDGKVGDLLTSEKVLKVIHDCRNDFECLFQEYGLCLANCFDTQVAYNICKKKTASYQVGLNRVLQDFDAPVNSQKESIDHNHWSERPLTSKQIQYAAEDVAFLLKVYEQMVTLYKGSMDNLVEYVVTRSMERVVYSTASLTMQKKQQELLAKYPLNTTRYFSFDEDGRVLLNTEPFQSNEQWKDSIFNEEEEKRQEEIRRNEKQLILQILPPRFQVSINRLGNMLDHATEIIYDLGRKPTIRLMLEMPDSKSNASSSKQVKSSSMKAVNHELQADVITMADIIYIADRLGDFTTDNRCGLSKTLHRISRKLNRQGDIIAFTIRFGHSVPGSTRLITDLIAARKSILLIGVPGVGKTTLLRELARILSTPSASNSSPIRVEIIDTSNEIAGDGDVPHYAIGAARRMMVRDRRSQHEVMIEAVQNHTPECIIIDEIGTKKEAKAASDITQRGVQLIGTVHGVELRHIIENAELNLLIGGVHAVVLGDDEAKRRKIRTKSVMERMGPCAFDCAIELRSLDTWIIHHDLGAAVDAVLLQKPLPLEVRRYDRNAHQMIVEKVNEFNR